MANHRTSSREEWGRTGSIFQGSRGLPSARSILFLLCLSLGSQLASSGRLQRVGSRDGLWPPEAPCDEECESRLGPDTPTPPGAPCGTTRDSNIVRITVDRQYRHFESNGCPGYDWTDQDVPQGAFPRDYKKRVPLHPVISSVPTYVAGAGDTTVLNDIGVALNGIPIFSAADHFGRNALIFEGDTFDHCGGHASFKSQYHYHIVPGDRDCLAHNGTRNNRFSYCPEIFWTESEGRHSPLFAYMADGIPIYGPQGDGGAVPGDLDRCNGHTDGTHPFYHYHGTSDFPLTARCLRGCVSVADWPNFYSAVPKCEPAAEQYDYSSLVPAAPALQSA